VTFCSGRSHAEDKVKSNSYKFLGLDIDGRLLILYRAVETNIQPGPTFLLRTGEFKLQEDSRTVLSEQESQVGTRSGKGFAAPGPYPSALYIAPWNGFASWRLSMKASLLRDSIDLSYRIESDVDNDWLPISITKTQRALKDILISSSCQHPTGKPMPVIKDEHQWGR
jgi:hypothetical protein